MIAIVDYGVGNVTAIENLFARLALPCTAVSAPDALAAAEKIILPGVGAFDDTMARLNGSGLRDMLDKKVLDEKTPCLGVCVGMQIMAGSSAEGSEAGLAWFEDSSVIEIALPADHGKPGLPHMGWNSVTAAHPHPILDGLDMQTGFYFLHSYRVACRDEDTLMTSRFGETFPCAIARDNIFGFQFHPEKSHANGLALFRNFAGL